MSTPFQFGSGSGASNGKFEFSAAGNAPSMPQKIFSVPGQAGEERGKGPGGNWVTLVQYEDLEQRFAQLQAQITALEMGRSKDKALMAKYHKEMKADLDLVEETQAKFGELVAKIKRLETEVGVAKAALSQSQAGLKAATTEATSLRRQLAVEIKNVEICKDLVKKAEASRDAAKTKLAAANAAVDTMVVDLDGELHRRLEIEMTGLRATIENEVLAEASANLDAAIVETDKRAAAQIDEEKKLASAKYDELLVVFEASKEAHDRISRGQEAITWWLFALMGLLLVALVTSLVMGEPAGCGGLGWGLFGGDSVFARGHAGVLTALVKATGGVKVVV